MKLEMKVPSPGESITEVEIAQWLVSDGDFVEKDQAIAEVDSDKATLDLPAEASGVITLKAEEGDSVEVGQVVCLIDTDATGGEHKPKSSSEIVEKKVDTSVENEPIITEKTYASNHSSPAARKILDEKGIKPIDIHGSGKGGRITKEDAINAKASMGTPPKGIERNSDKSKMSLLRRKVAERLVSAKNETAMLTTFNEANMSEIFSLRKKFKDSFNEKHNVTPTSIQKGFYSPLEKFFVVNNADEEGTIPRDWNPKEIPKQINKCRKEMILAAKQLNFEKHFQILGNS